MGRFEFKLDVCALVPVKTATLISENNQSKLIYQNQLEIRIVAENLPTAYFRPSLAGRSSLSGRLRRNPS